MLGRALRDFLATCTAGILLTPADGIRATVIGASEYTIQLSGATSYFTSTDPLPPSGFKVIHVLFAAGASFAERSRLPSTISTLRFTNMVM